MQQEHTQRGTERDREREEVSLAVAFYCFHFFSFPFAFYYFFGSYFVAASHCCSFNDSQRGEEAVKEGKRSTEGRQQAWGKAGEQRQVKTAEAHSKLSP